MVKAQLGYASYTQVVGSAERSEDLYRIFNRADETGAVPAQLGVRGGLDAAVYAARDCTVSRLAGRAGRPSSPDRRRPVRGPDGVQRRVDAGVLQPGSAPSSAGGDRDSRSPRRRDDRRVRPRRPSRGGPAGAVPGVGAVRDVPELPVLATERLIVGLSSSPTVAAPEQ